MSSFSSLSPLIRCFDAVTTSGGSLVPFRRINAADGVRFVQPSAWCVVHVFVRLVAVGVECTASGRRVLEAIAEMTDGSFTPYEWDGHAKGPPPKEDWTDLEIRRLRMENMANGVVDEPLPVTKAKVGCVLFQGF